MGKAPRKHGEDLRAASQLAVVATQEVTQAVQQVHRAIVSGPGVLGSPLALPARLITAVGYAPMKAITALVGQGLDQLLEQVGPLLGESTPGPAQEALLAALNGVVGDRLEESGSPLAIQMSIRHAGEELLPEREALLARLPEARPRLLLLIHGSSMNDGQWMRNGHDHGVELAKEFGFTPLHLHYNSGLHISTNGRALAQQLEALVKAWPTPVEEIALLGHSMGGLVARSACAIAESDSLEWRRRLTRLVTLGTPHHGSPLEQGGGWVHALLEVTAYSAPIARLAEVRSAGVTDLRFGNVLDAHWQGRDRFVPGIDVRENLSLPEGVSCHAIAATLSPEGTASPGGDGLVPVASALGQHARADLTLPFPEAHRWTAFATGHVQLLDRGPVFDRLRSWFAVA